MPSIEVDFETYKQITLLRPSEDVTEGDVIRWKLGLPSPFDSLGASAPENMDVRSQASERAFWNSEGVLFRIGDELRHWFRGNPDPVVAHIVDGGLVTDGKFYSSLSAAAIHHSGHNTNGWRFWTFKARDGQWRIAEQLRN